MKIKLRLLFYFGLFLLYLSYLIPYNIINSELVPYENEYLGYVHKYCHKNEYLNPIQKKLEIIDLDDDNVIARCSHNNLTQIHIQYNKKHWDKDSRDTRTIILWHEFTHCYFGEGHFQDPMHFMYAYNNDISLDTAKQQLEEYLQKKCK